MPKASRKPYHHGDLRNALIDAAVALLPRRGIAALSLREVATAVGVSHAAPYRHFRDKQALLDAIAARGHEHIRDGNRAARASWPDDPKRQWLEAGMQALNFMLDNPEIAQVMFGAAQVGKDGDPALRSAVSEAVAELAAIIEAGKAAGLYAGRKTEDVVLTSLSALNGLCVLITSGYLGEKHPDPREARQLGSRVAETLWRGLAD